MRPSDGKDAVVNIFESIPTSRITRARIGDRSLSDRIEPVDKLNIPLFERLANRWNLDAETLYAINQHKPVGMPLSKYLHYIAKLTPSRKYMLFPDNPHILHQLILKYPTGALRTAFDKLETPMGRAILSNAFGALRNISESNNPVQGVKNLLANIAAGFVKPTDVTEDLMKMVFEPLNINLNTLSRLISP